MIRGLRDAALLLGVLFCSGAQAACGIVANVPTSHDGGAGASGGDAGPGASGDGNGKFTNGETPGRSGQGGQGGDGASGTPSGGASGLTDSGAGVIHAPGNDAALARIDPHASERKELSRQLCGLLDKYPCLTLETGLQTVSPADQGAFCQNLTEASGALDACWSEWVDQMQCELARTDWCPCSDYCHFHAWDGDTPSHCTTTKAALDQCENSYSASGLIKGAAGSYTWGVRQQGTCMASSVLNSRGSFDAQCSGPAGGPQTCMCFVNGVFLGDQAQYVHNSYYYEQWLASDCEDVARQLAAGKCSDILDCCFTWTYNASPDAGPVEDCGCTADPTQAGYDSCEAMAAAGHGKVIDLCQRYRPNPGSFP